MAHRKKLADFSRYEQIALDLALRIIRDEYQIGERVSGRSTLAGRYKVSPETIRRAVALLEDAGVVETIAGTGIVIKSKKAAEDYFQAFEGEKAMANLQKKLNQLMETRRRLDHHNPAWQPWLHNLPPGVPSGSARDKGCCSGPTPGLSPG